MIAATDHLSELTAGEVMSSPVATVDEAGTLWQAGDLMISQRIHHVVVVSGDRCIGVLTDRDVLEAWHRGPSALRATPVRSLVASRTSCVLPDATMRQVAAVMDVNRVDAVPVVDNAGKLLGVITAVDVVAAVAQVGLVIREEESI